MQEITAVDIIQNYGNVLLKKNAFNGSPGKLVMLTFPEHVWESWKFPRARNFGMPDEFDTLQKYL